MTKNSQDEIIIKLKSLSSMFTEVKRLLNDAFSANDTVAKI